MSFFVTFHQERIEKSPANHELKGFTLIEMMVVIAIVSIVAAVATPLILQHRRDVSLKNAAYQISGNLHKAKALAIHNNTSSSINFNSPAADQYQIPNANLTFDLSTALGGVGFTNNPGDGTSDTLASSIMFNARGLCTTTGQIYVTNQDGDIYRIQTSGAGGISIQLWNAGTSKWN
jgi:prepilin-type N-terminal cleavage/methylation domain-containing protein